MSPYRDDSSLNMERSFMKQLLAYWNIFALKGISIPLYVKETEFFVHRAIVLVS